MIVPILLLLASQSTEMDSVIDRYRSFMAAHPSLSADVEISGAVAGKGVVTLRRIPNSYPKVDWQAFTNGAVFRFICDGKLRIDIDPGGSTYDRLPMFGASFPSGRLCNASGYPYALVVGDTPFVQLKKATVLIHKGDITELKATQHGTQGDLIITADFATDGRLTSYNVAKGQPGHMTPQLDVFSNYRFGESAAPSTFNTQPPIGYTPLAFDLPVDPLAAGQRSRPSN